MQPAYDHEGKTQDTSEREMAALTIDEATDLWFASAPPVVAGRGSVPPPSAYARFESVGDFIGNPFADGWFKN